MVFLMFMIPKHREEFVNLLQMTILKYKKSKVMIFENLKPFYTKLKNQKIIEIESDNVLYDLYNASQFLGFHYNLEKTSVALT